MRAVFYTIVGDSYYYLAGTQKLINSFKTFHPDIDLVVFRQDMIDKVFKAHNIDFYNAKPTFAKLLAPHYDLVVNIDCDSVVCARLDEVLKGDYDIGAVINKNDFENRTLGNVTEDMFLQGGFIASTNKNFWDIWEFENKNAHNYMCQENDVMNLVIYNSPLLKDAKLKIFDKDKDYYGCKSLNREGEFYIEKDKVMCRKEQVFIYHHAKGANVMPKLDFYNMPFTMEVARHLEVLSTYGKSICMGIF